MLKNKKILLVAILACTFGVLKSQVNSPYARYGYGILSDQVVGPSKGMGGIGYGLRTPLSANPLNPASYSRVDSLTFIFDIGASAKYEKLSDGTSSSSDYNGNFEYMTMLMPLSKRVGLSLGVLPFSSVSYSFDQKDDLAKKHFEGSGGISQAYAGLGYLTPIKGLSVGANVKFLFGSIDHYRSLPDSYISKNISFAVQNFNFDFGAQYEMKVSKENVLTLGALYTPAIQMKNDFEITEINPTVSSEVQQSTIADQDLGFPNTYGAGFTLSIKKNILLGADVTYQDWANVDFGTAMNDDLSNNNRFNNRMRYNLGGEYTINPIDHSYFKRIKFRAGLNYGNSYQNAIASGGKVEGFNEYGASLGFGLPLRDPRSYGYRTSYLNINFEYKKIKPGIKSMIDQQFFGVSVNVSLNELWFFKRKID